MKFSSVSIPTPQKPSVSDVILTTYTSQHGDSGGLVYSYTSSTNTRYTVGINRGSVIYNGEKLGVCVKAYMINKRLEVERY